VSLSLLIPIFCVLPVSLRDQKNIFYRYSFICYYFTRLTPLGTHFNTPPRGGGPACLGCNALLEGVCVPCVVALDLPSIIYIYIYIYVHICVYIYVYVCVYVCIYMYTYMYMYMCMCIYICIYICRYVFICTCICK